MDYIATFVDGHTASTLAHYGIPKMKWGVRRFQNPDGTLTEEGRRRYGVGAAASRAYEKSARYKAKSDSYALKSRRALDKYDQFKSDKLKRKSEKYAVKSSSQYAKAVKLSNKDDKIVNRRYSKSDIYSLEGAKRAGFLGAAVGKAVGVYKEQQERKEGPGYGSSTQSLNNQTVFVSGSSKTQDKDSGYYRKKLPSGVRYELREYMKRGDKIIVGDAPGIDRQVQDYLAKKQYTNVEVFSPGKEGARYLANKDWKQTNVDKPGAEIGSKEWLAAKDFVMSKLADKGIAVTIDEGAKATRKNVDRLVGANKEVMVYELGKDKGLVRNFLGLRGDRATTFINGKEVSEGYYDGYWITDPDNKTGVVPEHEYGTRTKEIASNKIAEENKRFARQASASIKSLRSSGHTTAEIAKMLGISESTVSKYANL